MEIQEETFQRQFQQNPKLMLIKASLKNHSPQQIYDYILQKVGQLGMKIKKRQAIIGFENPEFYYKLMSNYQNANIHGKKIKFSYVPEGDQNNIQSQQQSSQEIEILRQDHHSNAFPQLQSSNKMGDTINEWRILMLNKIQNLCQNILHMTAQRTNQLKLQFKDQTIRNREITCLETSIVKKMGQAENKFSQDIEKINKFIQQFSMKPTEIDLQPTFELQQKFDFPSLNVSSAKFVPYKYYLNTEHYPCKRLCAINGNQFAVTMNHSKKASGLVKIYNVDNSNQKQSVAIDSGAYGLCRVNNFLIIGSLDSSIKYVNLDDTDKLVETSQKISTLEKPSTIFDIKVSKPSVEKPEIVTLSTDHILRKFQLSFDEVCSGVFSANFEKNWEIKVSDHCFSFQIVEPHVILFGSQKNVKRYQIERKMMRQIPTNCTPTKIKKISSNLYAVSSKQKVQLFDIRTDSVVQTFDNMATQIRSIEILGDHSIMFGGKGQIGLIDDRNSQDIIWKSQTHHRDIVYDILKLKEKVISVDTKGEIYSWAIDNGGVGIQDGKRINGQMEMESI